MGKLTAWQCFKTGAKLGLLSWFELSIPLTLKTGLKLAFKSYPFFLQRVILVLCCRLLDIKILSLKAAWLLTVSPEIRQQHTDELMKKLFAPYPETSLWS